MSVSRLPSPRAVLLAVAVPLLAGCPKVTEPVPDGGRAPDCTTRADCAAGQICTPLGYCDHCDSSGQCSVKEVCDPTAKACKLRDGWGTDCTANEQCQAGSWCKQGLCLDRSQVNLCPGGTKAECPQGERCNVVTTVCEEDLGCSTDDDCSSGEVCNTGSRACVPRCTVDTQATVCAAGERCVNSKCVQCAADAECGPGLTCDAAGKCVAGSHCYSDRDCTVPLVCFIQTGACLPKAPPCVSNDNCRADQRCDVPSGKCVPKTCQPDRYEPDNDLAHAAAVAAGPYYGLTLCPGDIDWYALPMSRGDQLGVNVDADPFAENGFSAVVKDSGGRTLAAGHFLASYVAPSTGTYYVVVSTTDAFQPYDVTFLMSRGTPCDDDGFEPNDASTQATALQSTTLADGMVCPQDVDWFKVTVPAAKSLKASLVNYDSGKGLLRLCAVAPDGVTQLSCSEDPAPVVTVPANLAGGGTVLVRVTGSTERVSNAYTLKVEFP